MKQCKVERMGVVTPRQKKEYNKTDIFSAGCIAYYTYTQELVRWTPPPSFEIGREKLGEIILSQNF